LNIIGAHSALLNIRILNGKFAKDCGCFGKAGGKYQLYRLAYSDATLKELGEMLNPPLGKSGVNHRLRKLDKIAESLRNMKGEL